jgi:hypothetical protein
MGHFSLWYTYIPDCLKVEIEHDRYDINFAIIDTKLDPKSKKYANLNHLCAIYRDIEGEPLDAVLSTDSLREQISYLHKVIVGKNPQFYPIKRKNRAKTIEGQKYWLKYWEENP